MRITSITAATLVAATVSFTQAHAAAVWVSDSTNQIGLVDTTIQGVVANTVHQTGVNPLTDIAFLGTQMYGTSFTGLFKINQNTGATTSVGSYSGQSGMNALFGNGGSLLGASFNTTGILQVNPNNATLSAFAPSPTVSAGDITLFQGSLWASLGASGSPDSLFNISTQTTVGTFHVGSAGGPTLNDVFGLASDGTTLYAAAGTELYSVNSATAVLTPLFDWTANENGQHLGTVTGLAFLNESPPPAAAPEPATWGLLGLGFAGMLALRRRR